MGSLLPPLIPEITGVVEDCDTNMNTTLNTVRQVLPSGQVIEMEILLVSGSSIRYVHIPRDIPIVKHLNAFMKTIDRTSSAKGPHKIIDRKKKTQG